MKQTIRVFDYIVELDALNVTDEYREIGDTLGLSEWHPVVWIGRLFTMDNDFGEHWFDNWELREQWEDRAKDLGLDAATLFFIDPHRFQDGRDGPCHTPEFRKAFWMDVLCSLKLSLALLFEEARNFNARAKSWLTNILRRPPFRMLTSRIWKIG
jgi:hypothetical protein